MPGFDGFTLPAPNGGLNLVDAIDSMPPNTALELVNIFPTGLGAELRNGYDDLATTSSGNPLLSLTGLHLPDATTKIVGTETTKIWSFTGSGATDITGSTVPTDGNFNPDTFAHRLYLPNGVDTMQVYDGTTVADSTFSGVTLSSLINVSSFKERLWFVEKNKLKAWYGNSQATGASALNAYDFTYWFKRGGYLLFCGSWTNQVNTLAQDLFFACSSEGEILFYQGSSPADTWGLVARFVIGKPLGYRAFVRVGNDIWIITEQGIVPVSALFTMDPEQALDTVGRTVNPLIADYAKTIGFSHMWHGVAYPNGRRVFIVVPTSGSGSILLVYGMDAKGWTKYQLYASGHCISIANVSGSVYYGGANGTVYTGETGQNDNGEAIAFNGRLAFSFFGDRSTWKSFKDIRPLMRTRRGTSLQLALDTNFQRRMNIDTITPSSGTFTPWGSLWGSPWSSDIDYIYDRFAVKGQGHSAAIRFRGSIKDAPLELYGFEVRFNSGGQV